MPSNLIYPKESFAVRGAIFEVHNEMGTGFAEKVYQECLEKEFTLRGIPFVREQQLRIQYKGELLTQDYYPDFVCYGKIVVECKTVKEIEGFHKAQLLNYMKASNFRLGFLVNFSETFINPLRFVNFNWDAKRPSFVPSPKK